MNHVDILKESFSVWKPGLGKDPIVEIVYSFLGRKRIAVCSRRENKGGNDWREVERKQEREDM